MSDSLFTRIIRGEIPSHKIYEDAKTLAFLDIHPAQLGHTLVIPKTQVEQLWDLSDEDYQAVMTTTKKVAKRLREQLKTKSVGVKVIGIHVPHAHVQLIPFSEISEYQAAQDMGAEPDHPALAALAEKLFFTD